MRRKENRFFEQSDNKFLQIARDFNEVCLKCNSIDISIRKRKKPKYFCHNCKNEFDDPKAMIVNKTTKQKNEYGKQYDNTDE